MNISIALQKLLETGDISDIYVVIFILAIIAISPAIITLFCLLIREKNARLKDTTQYIKYLDKLTTTLEEQAKSSNSVLAVLRYSKCFKCILQKEDDNGCNQK